jgi:hypothetical protein
VSKLTWGVVIGGIIIILVIVVAASGGGSSGTDSTAASSSSDTLSPETATYLDSAMPMLAQTLAEFQAGNVEQAATYWKSIGTMPINNETDDYVSGDYLTYANNVRYYMIGDGSCDLRTLEDSKTTAEMTIAAARY